ncbi:MAG: hypothetical protein FRX48_06558 [Lasallia pustulata]|uniref:Phosphatidylethanolamine-binding protein PEBP n=1 Tax=Lasallia pustulata TaxID=136370 RepID=A0A5M8PN86_9LECA|nr:MAG: hypothetical protein FRX48_06558 [Lasallia pustulata]
MTCSPALLSTLADVASSLKKSSIIPDVLDDFTPSVSLHLSYPPSHSDVSLGNRLSPSDVKASPFFSISPLSLSLTPSRTLKPDTTYTLALTDPDATSRSDPKKGEMCHWIATNITLESSTAETRDVVFTPSFDELMPYIPPSPPPKTGYHRYVFVLLAPPSSTEASPNAVRTTGLGLKKPKDRPHWGYGKVGKGVRDWAEDNDLVVVGANFFYTENEKQ